jgi:hypothetical protein
MKENGEKVYYGEIIPPVKSRPKPEAYLTPPPVEVINIVNHYHTHHHTQLFLTGQTEAIKDPYERAGFAVGDCVFFLAVLLYALSREAAKPLKNNNCDMKG